MQELEALIYCSELLAAIGQASAQLLPIKYRYTISEGVNLSAKMQKLIEQAYALSWHLHLLSVALLAP